jgi:AraC family transcriptional regulator
MEYAIKDLPAVRLAGLRYKGPFGPAIGEFWREVFTPWQKAYNLVNRATYGIALDNPDTTPPSETRYDACVEVAADYPVAAPAIESTLPAGRYAVASFHGTAQQMPAAWGELMGKLHGAGLVAEGACFERYAADGVPDPVTGEFHAELCVPVK